MKTVDRRRRAPHDHRVDRDNAPTLTAWKDPARAASAAGDACQVVVDCGWGRLIFGHTFADSESLAVVLKEEQEGCRDIALYIAEPHVMVALCPAHFFLDPSHTYRMYLAQLRSPAGRQQSFVVRKLTHVADAEAIAGIYARRHMVPVDPAFIWENRAQRTLTYLVAEDSSTGEVIGTVTGVDHVDAFGDRENGSSLWALAVDPQTTHPGVGEALVVHLLEHYAARGRAFLDLSVLYDNKQAIRLYEKLGFIRVPVFCVKRKNPINEPLFIADPPEALMNPYAAIIAKEARRRGIAVASVDPEAGYFALTFGGRTIVCRESLTELTHAIAMSRCDDKQVTRRVLLEARLNVPAQQPASAPEDNARFLELYGRIVVKPARGEQGNNVFVDVRGVDEMERAIELARGAGTVLLEELVDGSDLRIVVIDFRVVAAAVRRPPAVVGTGEHTVRALLQTLSRRRSAATGGESRIPMDGETERAVRAAGHELDDVLAPGERVMVRKTANLHTGGTIHDVTAELHPRLVQAAERAAEALDIPVVGLDFIVPDVCGARYWIIEANERPGLANHEPQPTAERLVDLLFPQTAAIGP